uniref:Ovule protein n=1 Tax=Gongylonema pulchrum TaxID=637853 RepID=A0A183D817_9BILA
LILAQLNAQFQHQPIDVGPSTSRNIFSGTAATNKVSPEQPRPMAFVNNQGLMDIASPGFQLGQMPNFQQSHANPCGRTAPFCYVPVCYIGAEFVLTGLGSLFLSISEKGHRP